MVSSLWPPRVLGGAEIYAARLAKALEESGHVVGALTFGVSGDGVVATARAWPYHLEEFAAQTSWRRAVFRAVDVYNPVARRTLTEAVATFEPDVIHSHSIAGLSTSVLAAAARSNAAHLHTLHDYWLLCRRTTFVKKSGEACVGQCASCRAITGLRSAILHDAAPDLLIAPTAAMAERHAALGWAKDRIHQLSHPVDDAPPRSRPVPGAGRPVTFGFAGQLTQPKGVLTLLAAFEALAADGHALVVAGRGPLADAVAHAGTGVTAAGWLEGDRLDAFYDSIDCLVVPSEWPENAPLVVLEARARGIPVIAARTGGLPEIVDAASQPLLFPPGDTAELRRTMCAYIADPAAFTPSGRGGMSWSEHVAALVALYEQVAASKTGGARRA